MAEPVERRERRYGGRSGEQRRADRQRRLLDAGLECFGTQGFRATTVSDLCRTAGVAPIHFYEEHTGREALLEAVYDEIMSTARVEVDAALRGAGTDVGARARAGLDAFCHAMLDDPRRARVQCIEIVGVSPTMEVRRHEGLLRYATLLVESFLEPVPTAAATGRSTVPPVEPAPSVGLHPPTGLRTMAVALVGGVNEALIDWLLAPVHQPISSLVDALSDVFIATGEYLSRVAP